jgi:hypothetical protein
LSAAIPDALSPAICLGHSLKPHFEISSSSAVIGCHLLSRFICLSCDPREQRGIDLTCVKESIANSQARRMAASMHPSGKSFSNVFESSLDQTIAGGD